MESGQGILLMVMVGVIFGISMPLSKFEVINPAMMEIVLHLRLTPNSSVLPENQFLVKFHKEDECHIRVDSKKRTHLRKL